jgi:hypothetical protein
VTTVICGVTAYLGLEQVHEDFDFDPIFHVVADGDDVICFLCAELVDFVDQVKEAIQFFGAEIVIESVATKFEEIEFCSSRPVVRSDGVMTMSRDPSVVLAKGVIVTRVPDERQARLDHVYTVGMCSMYNNWGLPILQEWASCLIRNSLGGTLTDNEDMERAKWGLPENFERSPIAITEESRLSVERAYGIPCGVQLQVESDLRNFKFQSWDDEFLAKPDSDTHLNLE